MQTTYNDPLPAVQGGLGDSGPRDVKTGVAATVVPFGRGLVERATPRDGVALPTAITELFAGVSLQTHKAKPNTTGVAQYEINEAIPHIRKGRVWVYSETAVAPNQPVHMRALGTGNPGDFRNAADATNTMDVSAYARWVSVNAAAGLALLDINLP